MQRVCSDQDIMRSGHYQSGSGEHQDTRHHGHEDMRSGPTGHNVQLSVVRAERDKIADIVDDGDIKMRVNFKLLLVQGFVHIAVTVL